MRSVSTLEALITLTYVFKRFHSTYQSNTVVSNEFIIQKDQEKQENSMKRTRSNTKKGYYGLSLLTWSGTRSRLLVCCIHKAHRAHGILGDLSSQTIKALASFILLPRMRKISVALRSQQLLREMSASELLINK